MAHASSPRLEGRRSLTQGAKVLLSAVRLVKGLPIKTKRMAGPLSIADQQNGLSRLRHVTPGSAAPCGPTGERDFTERLLRGRHVCLRSLTGPNGLS